MPRWLLFMMLMAITLLNESVAVTKMQSLYVSSSDVNQWSKSLIGTHRCRSSIECLRNCLNVNCVHYDYNKENEICDMYSEKKDAAGLGGSWSIKSKIKCSVDGVEMPGLSEGGWQVLLRRLDGSVDFNRTWADYRAGFGNPCGEFWLGLETIHTLTSSNPYKLRVEMTAWDGDVFFSEYSSFSLGPESVHYQLSVSGYEPYSTAGDSLATDLGWPGISQGRMFTTYDKDNDLASGSNCAVTYKGGWWFHDCLFANPMGIYKSNPSIANGHGIVWHSAYGNWYTFKRMVMKIKP